MRRLVPVYVIVDGLALHFTPIELQLEGVLNSSYNREHES